MLQANWIQIEGLKLITFTGESMMMCLASKQIQIAEIAFGTKNAVVLTIIKSIISYLFPFGTVAHSHFQDLCK